jgi:hypothetical protein
MFVKGGHRDYLPKEPDIKLRQGELLRLCALLSHIIRVPEATLSPGFVIPSGQNRIRRSVFLFSIQATSSVAVIQISAEAFLEVENNI